MLLGLHPRIQELEFLGLLDDKQTNSNVIREDLSLGLRIGESLGASDSQSSFSDVPELSDRKSISVWFRVEQ